MVLDLASRRITVFWEALLLNCSGEKSAPPAHLDCRVGNCRDRPAVETGNRDCSCAATCRACRGTDRQHRPACSEGSGTVSTEVGFQQRYHSGKHSGVLRDGESCAGARATNTAGSWERIGDVLTNRELPDI